MPSVNFIMNSLFIITDAVKRLVMLAGDNRETVLRCFQRIIDDPVYRRQVWLAMTGQLLVTEITKQEWIERETNAMRALGLLEEDALRIEIMANRDGVGINRYFIPAGLTRKDLVELAGAMGIKLNDSPHCDGQKLPTEAGTLECDLSAIMTSTNADHQPFLLNYDEHEAWAKAQGGDGITSAEEALYLLIRHFMAFGRILFMGGWIRCRNPHDAAFSLSVAFNADAGLNVNYDNHSNRNWHYGAVAR
jgi:hypothetical protein